MQFSEYTLICEVWTKSPQVVTPRHALTFIPGYCWNIWLVYSNGSIEQVRSSLTGRDEIFTRCNFVIPSHSLYWVEQTSRRSFLFPSLQELSDESSPVNVQFRVIRQSLGHSFTNFCKCCWISGGWQPPSIWINFKVLELLSDSFQPFEVSRRNTVSFL